jgi:hypothetical protein
MPTDPPQFLSLELWQSDFAILALVHVSKADLMCIDQTLSFASQWLLPLLEGEEKSGRLIDGYLLLALPAKPDGDLLTRVREIERETSLCRKHVLWPDDDNSWSASLNGVTTLGLPAAAPPSGALVEPTLPSVATQALIARDRGMSLYDVATMIEDMPEAEKKNAS